MINNSKEKRKREKKKRGRGRLWVFREFHIPICFIWVWNHVLGNLPLRLLVSQTPFPLRFVRARENAFSPTDYFLDLLLSCFPVLLFLPHSKVKEPIFLADTHWICIALSEQTGKKKGQKTTGIGIKLPTPTSWLETWSDKPQTLAMILFINPTHLETNLIQIVSSPIWKGLQNQSPVSLEGTNTRKHIQQQSQALSGHKGDEGALVHLAFAYNASWRQQNTVHMTSLAKVEDLVCLALVLSTICLEKSQCCQQLLKLDHFCCL